MTVFFCAKCGTALTPELARLPAVPVVEDADTLRDKKTCRARSTIPRGFYAVDPEPWGAPFVAAMATPRVPPPGTGRELLRPSLAGPTVSAGPRDTIIVHPEDVPGLVPFVDGDNQTGCCGPTGANGPNLACSLRVARWDLGGRLHGPQRTPPRPAPGVRLASGTGLTGLPRLPILGQMAGLRPLQQLLAADVA